MSRSVFSFWTSRRSRSISACSGFGLPCPGNAWPGSPWYLLDPLAQLVLVDIEIPSRLGYRDTTFSNKLDGLDLELRCIRYLRFHHDT